MGLKPFALSFLDDLESLGHVRTRDVSRASQTISELSRVPRGKADFRESRLQGARLESPGSQ